LISYMGPGAHPTRLCASRGAPSLHKIDVLNALDKFRGHGRITLAPSLSSFRATWPTNSVVAMSPIGGDLAVRMKEETA